MEKSISQYKDDYIKMRDRCIEVLEDNRALCKEYLELLNRKEKEYDDGDDDDGGGGGGGIPYTLPGKSGAVIPIRCYGTLFYKYE